ncbi:patatin-domain-containing protein [Fistulina hepatica ATCC 64428]|uniref:Lysophospholipase NTE1 n=1 Tax=Fistulina hepatica ATCC 64428 TaxID=1128425 RepID=A0A0D7A5P7_9AGAR|nr:patatin-domain-containing protein [Fistulina hepatica ATCC 64428]
MEHSSDVVEKASHPLISLVSASFWVILWLLSWAKSLIGFATITVPRLIYAILSLTVTLTLNFWSFAIIFVASAVALNYYIRFRYLNNYSHLKEPPLVHPDAKELHPDANPDLPPTFHNYLDDFLQAVRVFGFLEKPVFHELARHLQTRRLIAGDSISLDQDRSFYCVVDGTVQVFARASRVEDVPAPSAWEDEDMNGYQLLNEVGSGGTLSSLFTILSLFTENVKMSWNDGNEDDDQKLSPSESGDVDVSHFQLDPTHVMRRTTSISSRASTIHAGNAFGRSTSSTVTSPRTHPAISGLSEDSTLAVIPAEAFYRLTRQFPKAAGHIVQVILTRFSRVTFNAAHKYLGLTSEVLRAEKAMNELACHPLPASFYEGGGLRELRHRFDSNLDSDEETDAISVISSGTDHNASRMARNLSTVSSMRVAASRYQVHAGDLLSSTLNDDDFSTPFVSGIPTTPRMRINSERPNLQRRRATSDEFNLREEVMSCIAKSIGLLQPPMSDVPSGTASPFVPSADQHRSPPPIANSFGSLSLLELSDEVSSTTTGSSSSATSSHGYMRGLDNEVEILFFSAGSTLAKAGDVNAGLFYVIEGLLDILIPEEGDNDNDRPDSTPESHKFLFTVKPGGIAGYLASLTNTVSYVDIKAKTDSYVGFLPMHALERLIEKRPIVLLTLAKRLISLLSPLVLHVDSSLDWMQVNAGQVIWRPQDVSDCFYIVINGRLRTMSEDDQGNVHIVGEYGQGDAVGELDVITSSRRRTTLHAIRDTELIRLPQTLFNAISSRNPSTTAQILRKIASRVRDEADVNSSQHWNQKIEAKYNSNLKTIAILPSSRSVPVETFARKLQSALEGVGAATAYLDQTSVSKHLGRLAFTRMGKLKAAGWLADQEQRYRTVLYVADSPANSAWTQTCIRQADCVMVVGVGDDPALGEYERVLQSIKTTARKELVLLHPDRSVAPGSTREWLKIRPWIQQHFHVELPGLLLPISKAVHVPREPDPMMALKNLKDKVQSEIKKYRGHVSDPRPQRLPIVSDFSRLARRICGKSVGVVLGGGGARGIAHLGLIQALEEYGIPIDHIGGTSIGAFIGGLYAREGDLFSSAGRAKQFSGRMSNIWRMLSDVTYPIVAYTTGHEFNRAIYKAFYDLHIEDMWLPFFSNTTNITSSRMEIHQTGYAWRFIRASMSLVGLVPPLCDNDGNMLVDGGYVSNSKVAAMMSMGASAVFACDVASTDDNSPRKFGDSVSGWWLMIARWNPFSSARHIPAITEIQSRLAYVSSVVPLKNAKTTRGSLYIQMPVQEYGTLQFSKFEELQKIGYDAAISQLKKWEEEGKLPSQFVDGKTSPTAPGRRPGKPARRNSI